MTRIELTLVLLAGCVRTPEPLVLEPDCQAAVVTDIDETLTVSDEEFLAQIVDPTHDPLMRPEANALMQGYADRGFTIFYITARGDQITLSDGRTAREATEDWLVGHGFPRSTEDVFLAEGLPVFGEDAIAYKSAVVEGLSAEFEVLWGYGNATSDIDGFRLGGLGDEQLYLVGELAGTMGVTGISDAAAYGEHLSVLGDVRNPCLIPPFED